MQRGPHVIAWALRARHLTIETVSVSYLRSMFTKLVHHVLVYKIWKICTMVIVEELKLTGQ